MKRKALLDTFAVHVGTNRTQIWINGVGASLPVGLLLGNGDEGATVEVLGDGVRASLPVGLLAVGAGGRLRLEGSPCQGSLLSNCG